MISNKTDHLTEAYGKLISVFRQDNIKKILASYIAEIQEIEAVFTDIRDVSDISIAEGDALDGEGATVGQNRGARDDALMRKAIAAKRLLTQANGTIDNLLALIQIVVGDVTIVAAEDFPAAMQFDITDDLSLADGELELLKDVIQTGKGAAVRVDTQVHTAYPFRYDIAYGYDAGGNGHWGTTI